MVVFYAVCMGVGFIFALAGAVFGEILGHGMIGGHGVEIGHGHGVHIGHGDVFAEHGGASDQMPGASIFNTITLSTFIAFFGGGGLIATLAFGFGPIASLATALPTGVAIAACQFVVFVKLFVKAQAWQKCNEAAILQIVIENLPNVANVIA